MKTFLTKEIIRTAQILQNKTCDLCGVNMPLSSMTYPNIFSETIVSYSHGTVDSDGGSSTKKIEVDICPECFMNKLVPFLKKEGAKIVEQEEDS